jgi:hypothetical protein
MNESAIKKNQRKNKPHIKWSKYASPRFADDCWFSEGLLQDLHDLQDLQDYPVHPV